MPHYKDLQNKLHWLDSTEHEHYLPAGCVQITDEEADALVPQPTSVESEPLSLADAILANPAELEKLKQALGLQS
jgi:hypothetical protein